MVSIFGVFGVTLFSLLLFFFFQNGIGIQGKGGRGFISPDMGKRIVGSPVHDVHGSDLIQHSLEDKV